MRAGFAMEPIYETDYFDKRIVEFKEDPENMKVVAEFVDDVLRIAKIESENKIKSQQEPAEKPARENLGSYRKSIKLEVARKYPTFEIFFVSMKQFDGSLDMMRSICAPKHKVTTEMLDNLRKGDFLEDKELKCYTKCVAQMAGTLSKKGELSAQRVIAQIDIILPQELRESARAAFEHCKEVRSVLSSFKNGRIVHRARGVMIRIFDVICNCANSATVPTQRLSTKRSSKN